MSIAKIILKLMAGLLAILVGILVVGIVVINAIDWNKHRDTVADLVMRYTDYEIRKLEYLDVNINFHPNISLKEIDLVRTKDSTPLSSFQADQFEIQVSLWPLVSQNQLRIDYINLLNSQIVIDTKDIVPEAPPLEPKEKIADFPAPFLKSASILNTVIILEGSPDNEPVAIAIENFKASSTAENEPVYLVGHGSIRDLPFHLSGEMGSLKTFIADENHYPLVLEVAILENQLKIEGSLATQDQPLSFNFNIKASGRDVKQLAAVFDVNLGQVPPYKIALSTTRTQNKIDITDISITLGKTYLYGDIGIDLDRERPFIQANLGSPMVYLKDLVAYMPEAPVEEPDPAMVEGPIFNDESLPVELLKVADADLRFVVNEIDGGYPGDLLAGLMIEAKLDNGRLVIDPLDIFVGDGTLGGQIIFDSSDEPAQFQMEIGMKKLEMARLIAPFIDDLAIVHMEPQEVLAGNISGNIALESNGQSMRELASRMGGSINFAVEQGQITATLIQALGTDFPKAIASWLAGNPVISIECMIAMFEANAGVINTKTMLISTPDYNVFGDGEVNLREESLSYRIETRAKNFTIGSTQSPIEIKGPFQDVGVQILTGELLTRIGAALLATMVNPALAVVPFVDLGLEKEGSCGKFVQTIQKIEVEAGEKVTD